MKRTVLKDTVSILSIALVTLFLLKYVFIPGNVSSESMNPTLTAGDYIVLSGLAYAVQEPRRGDVICFWSEEFDERLIKRIVGLPGEEISFTDGFVYINGSQLDEPYLQQDVRTFSPKVFRVPTDAYFVMGDNREDSLDSRFWEDPYVKRKAIEGKYLIRLFHI